MKMVVKWLVLVARSQRRDLSWSFSLHISRYALLTVINCSFSCVMTTQVKGQAWCGVSGSGPSKFMPYLVGL
jgi:hypothetical protein